MFDCANVEMRELLPELVAGTLDVSTRARVEAHALGCAECASELETLRLVRSAFATAPGLDTRRIVSSLPKPPALVSGASAPRVKRWVDWRVAAALTMITVGGLSVAVTERIRTSGRDVVPVVPESLAVTDDTSNQAVSIPPNVPGAPNRSDTGIRTAPRGATTPSRARAELTFGGGVNDLDDASLRALLGALEEIDRAPVAPSAEPDRTPVLPVIKEGER